MDELQYLEDALQQRQEALIMIQIARQQRWQAIQMTQRTRYDCQQVRIMRDKALLALEQLQTINIDPAIWITG